MLKKNSLTVRVLIPQIVYLSLKGIQIVIIIMITYI